ncbi:hypothetical protein OG21DRAFT_1479386 [Imleria badia]|nr:hypothetical protein OG21DRAFT_1479386 [Imleria badia]
MHKLRKVQGSKVTHVTLVTKETTRGQTSRLVRLATQQTPQPQSETSQTPPAKASRSTFQPLPDENPIHFDDNFTDFEEIRPSRFTTTKTSNDYMREWFNHKDEFLSILLDLEAPPEPHKCFLCQCDGVYKCSDCFGQPLLCTWCCQMQHQRHPFHRLQQWTGSFFKDSSLNLAGFELHLYHNGEPCLARIPPRAGAEDKSQGLNDEAWVDVDKECIPPHLRLPEGSEYLTIINITGIHFIVVRYCNCPGSLPEYEQLLHSNLFPATNHYCELLRVARKWRLLKLLKWNGFGHTSQKPTEGQLVLFCPACPQPGVNCHPLEDELTERDPVCSWKYTRTIVMDGNFKAEHMHERLEYRKDLKATHHPPEKSTCYNHRAVNQAKASRGKLEATGIGGMAASSPIRQVNMDYSFTNAIKYNMGEISRVISFYDINCNYMKNLQHRVCSSAFIGIPEDIDITARIGIWHVHGHQPECFSRHGPLFITGAGWVDGEIIETLWSMLNIVSGSSRSMSAPHRQELLNFQMNDSNFMKMIQMTRSLVRKLQVAKKSAASTATTFHDLDASVLECQRTSWEKQESKAIERRIADPSAMDIFDIQFQKAPTIRAMEVELLTSQLPSEELYGRVTTWLARGLKIEEAQISLARDMRKLGARATDLQHLALARRITDFIAEVSAYLEDDLAEGLPSDESDGGDHSGDDENPDSLGGQRPDQAKIPLPSLLGDSKYQQPGWERLRSLELRLWMGQANNALHEIRLALADKAVLFRTDVQHAVSHARSTRAWSKVHVVDTMLGKHAAVYRRCRKAMLKLGADEATLARYQALREEDLKVTSAAMAANARGNRNQGLAWFWSMDVLRDMERDDWMSEFYRVHWLRAKAMRDRWMEEEELLTAEFEWTISFFKHKAAGWNHRSLDSRNTSHWGAAGYAVCQEAIYRRLGDQCWAAREESILCRHCPSAWAVSAGNPEAYAYRQSPTPINSAWMAVKTELESMPYAQAPGLRTMLM